MFFINFIRLVLGYITFSAAGGFPERFINMCALNGIPLWDIRSIKGVLYAKTSIQGYKNIRKSARKSGMKPRIYKKHGLPFFMNKYRYRVGFLVGVAIFFLIIAVMSTRLWTIEVEGNKAVSDEVILSVFEELGVKVGARTSKIDVKKVQEQAYDRLSDLSWLALNISGSDAVIEVREGIKPPEMVDENKPCNVISTFDGQIIKLEVYEGIAAVNIGDSVVKGDLLISGVVENMDKTSDLYHARGLITAKTERKIIVNQSTKTKLFVCTDEKSRIRLLFFGFDVPVWPLPHTDKNYVSFSHRYQLIVSDKKIPIGYIKQGCRCYERKEVTLTETQRNLVAFESFVEEMRAKVKDSKILETDVTLKSTSEKSKITGKFICEENIGLEQEIYVEK